MESLAPERIDRYRIVTIVTKIREIKPNAIQIVPGWYVSFKGSWESLFLGEDKPQLIEGETVSIIIQKHTLEMQDAQPSPTPVE